MSNPTTPFGWQMPTNTDLVTDLPADFAVFGQAVATSMQDLLGGTTGQILAKQTGTDMDFVWTTPNPGDITGVTAGVGISGGGTSGDVTVTNSMATAFTTSGDLIQATGSGTFARLGTGTNGQYLTTNGTTNSWGTVSAGGMTLISTTALSGATTTISSIPSTYINLQLIFTAVQPATDGAVLQVRMNGTSQTECAADMASTSVQSQAGADLIKLTRDTYNAADTRAWLQILDYASTTNKGYFGGSAYLNTAGSSAIGFFVGGATRTSTSAISSIVIKYSTGNITSGSVKLYGMK